MGPVEALDRSSAVPLYYQLQELLRQQIESGVWGAGSALPSEHELSGRYGVSRVCVRQALAILAADGAIDRRRGHGTFVTPNRMAWSVPGLARTLVQPGIDPPLVRVLDRRLGSVEASVCRVLQAPPEEILRLTTLWSVGALACAIGVSFFRAADVGWLDDAIVLNQPIRLPGAAPQLLIGDAEVSIETTTCGRYEADLLGIAHHSTLMVTVSVHRAAMGDGERPLEVMRLGFVGDRVQLRFRGVPVANPLPSAWAFDA